MGCEFFGGISSETLILHRADMWHAGKETPVPDVTNALKQMRKLHSEGKNEEACNVMFNALNAAIMHTLGQKYQTSMEFRRKNLSSRN